MADSSEGVVLAEFLAAVGSGETGAPVVIIYELFGGMPSQKLHKKLRVYRDGTAHATYLDVPRGIELREATTRLPDEETAAFFRATGSGFESLVPRSEAAFVPDSVVGILTLQAGRAVGQALFPSAARRGVAWPSTACRLPGRPGKRCLAWMIWRAPCSGWIRRNTMQHGDLSVKGIARVHGGIADTTFSVLTDLLQQAPGSYSLSLRERLEAMALTLHIHDKKDCIYVWTAAWRQSWTHVLMCVNLVVEPGVSAESSLNCVQLWVGGIHNFWNRSGLAPGRGSWPAGWTSNSTKAGPFPASV